MARRTVEDRIRWLESNWTVKDGTPYSLEGREWVREQIIRPLYGWRIWSRGAQGEPLCSKCAKHAGRIVEWSPELSDVIKGQHHAGHDAEQRCPGLKLVKIQVIVVCINRRGGKTTNVCAVAGERIAHDAFQEAMMFAAAGSQTEKLFKDNLLEPLLRIENDGGELEEFTHNGSSVTFPGHHSQLTIVDSSRRSVTGRGENLLLVEEARDVDGVLFARAVPSILDRNYLLCPNGHRFQFKLEDSEELREVCEVCTERLEPHLGCVVIVSSAGVLESSPDLQWFPEMVTQLERHPSPSFHVFRDDDVKNPAIAKQSQEVLAVLEQVPSLAEAIGAERSNTFAKRGQSFVNEAEARRCVDRSMIHQNGYAGPCVLFLDTSLKKDLISLVAMATDDGTEAFWGRPPKADKLPPWTLVSVPSIFTWDPKKLPGGVADDPVMFDELADIVPLFPGALELWVDVRVQPWAHRLVERAHRSERSKGSWGRLFKRYQHGGKEKDVRRAGYKLLWQRVTGRTIRYFHHERMLKEFGGLIRKVGVDGDWDAVDQNRKVMHADVVSSMASLCELVWKLQVARKTTLKSIKERSNPEIQRLFERDERLGPARMSLDSW